MAIAVSVVIPAYQNATTLDRALACLSAQNVADWQAIIACDGATDGTLQIAVAAAERDPRISVLPLEHRGVSVARNAAIAVAEGDWLLFLDGDDTISPRYFARMLRVARRNPDAGIIACGYNRIDEFGRVSARHRPLPLDRDGLAVCVAGPPGAIHSFLVRRELVVAANGFDETLSTNEDWDFWLRLAKAGARFAVTNARLAHYWSTPNSLSRNGVQMVHDAAIVQKRAQAFNIAPPLGLEWLDRRDFTQAELTLRNIFWSAGVAIGQGKPVLDFFDGTARDVDYRFQKSQLVMQLLNGLAVGCGASNAQLASRWPAIREGLDDLLGALSRHLGEGHSVRPIAETLQVEIARHGRFAGQIDFGLVIGVSLTLPMLVFGYRPQTAADTIVFRAQHLRPATIFSFAAPLLGPMTGRDVRAVVRRAILRRIENHLSHRRSLLMRLAVLGRIAALARRAMGLRQSGPSRMPALSAVSKEAEAITARLRSDSVEAPAPITKSDGLHPGVQSSAAEWDAFFEKENPWGYGSAYEQIKYERTLSLISPRPDGRALELACAEGWFTGMLAGIVGSLQAVDISHNALRRAEERTAGRGTISFEQRDMFRQGVEGRWDIITCSEVMYFTPSRAALVDLARSIADALNPGGQFVHAHAYEVEDSPGRTAFDWKDTVGAQTIFTTFRDTPGLRHARSIVTDLYRIDLFERTDGAVMPEPVVTEMEIGCAMEPAVAASVVWNGALVTRKAALAERTYRFPVLLYHGVSTDDAGTDPYCVRPSDLERQLRFLRRRGYRSVTPEELLGDAMRGGSLRGRAVMVSFDTLNDDFIDRVWPMIFANGFRAHVFVTPDEIAAVERSRLQRLIEEGVTFGSRLRGVDADRLDSRELLHEALSARLALEQVLGGPIDTVAPPGGLTDTCIETLLAAAGFRRSFVSEGGCAMVCGYEMRTPRIEIIRDTTLAEFARLVEAHEAPEALDG